MTKKILYIILGAIFAFGLLFLLWSWLFSGSNSAQTNGQFGTASNTTQNGGAGANANNGTTNLNQNSANGTITLGGNGTGNSGTTGNSSTSTYTVNASGATITGANGGASTIGGIAVGNAVAIQGTVNGNSVTASSITIQGSGGANSGSTGAALEGTVTSIQGSTITISGTAGGGTVTVGGGVSVGTIGSSTNGTTFSTASPGVEFGTASSTLGIVSGVPGVTWLGSPFNPTDINSISSGVGGFTPTITTANSSGGGTTLIEALAATAIAGTLTCAIQAGLVALPGLTGGAAFAGAVGSGGAAVVSVPVSDALTHVPLNALSANQIANNTGHNTITFEGCLVNVIAKTVLQQITASVVNWINSGFNGQPSFVSNYQQFFTNVADMAAGQFIQGSALSFLCSPFKLQIKIAVAQSYANRGAQSCTLTGVINNINSFMNGNFSQGGWPGLISYTTTPTNNPYGAYAYAQVGLVSAQNTALSNAKNNISPTGFLNLQQIYGCTDPTQNGIGGSASIGTNPQAAAAAGSAALPAGCKTKVVTPGGAIADSLGAVNKSGVDQLGLASDIDQIITALTTQLMTRMLQNGLSSLSQSTTQTPADIAAESQATSLLNSMQNDTTIAEQLGEVYQGSISDIESAQANLNDTANCWSTAASSTTNTAAAQNAAAASTTLQSLENQVTAFNNDITQVNDAIAALNQFELQVSSAASDADVATVTSSYNSAVSAGTFPSQTDLTTAQQNRATLQSNLAAINSTAQSGLAQCQAILDQ